MSRADYIRTRATANKPGIAMRIREQHIADWHAEWDRLNGAGTGAEMLALATSLRMDPMTITPEKLAPRRYDRG